MSADTKKTWKAIEWARDILQLGDDASLAEIKRAYHRMCKLYHPDSASSEAVAKDTEEMYQVTAAYELLMRYCSEYRFPLQRPEGNEMDTLDPEQWWYERFGENPLWGTKEGKRKRS